MNPHQSVDSGGYSYEPVDENVKEMKELECPICCLLMRDVMELGCHHAMCKTCLDQWKKQSSNSVESVLCPQCRTTIEIKKIVSNGIVNRLITTSIKVRCENSPKGCDWIGVIADIQMHFADECEFVVVNCGNDGCDRSLQRNEMQLHLVECGYKEISCEYCGGSIKKCEIEKHHEICKEYPVECKNDGCEEKILRRLVGEHLTNECDFIVVKCQFEGAGCEFECKRFEMKEHTQNETNKHLVLMMQSLKVTNTKLEQAEKELTYLRDIQGKTLQRMAYVNISNIIFNSSSANLENACKKAEEIFLETKTLIALKISEFDEGLKRFVCGELYLLNNELNELRNGHNTRLQSIVSDILIDHDLLNEELQKIGVFLGFDELKKESDECMSLFHKRIDNFGMVNKDITYHESYMHVFNQLEDCEVMVNNNFAVVKLNPIGVNFSSCNFYIEKSLLPSSVSVCNDDEIIVGLKELYYSAALCVPGQSVFIPMTFSWENKQRSLFKFPYSETNGYAEFQVNGYVLILCNSDRYGD